MYNVLVTDDNALNRKLIVQILRGSVGGIHFFEAENGEECLTIMGRQDIDLLILDLMMPVLDGFEVIRRMKQDSHICDIPVIINSAVEDLPSIQQLLLDGVSDYFSKPLMPDEMKIFLPLKVKNALLRYEQHKKLSKINERNQKELMMASALQCSMMADYKRFIEAEMFGGYLPSHEIGGDFYDCVEHHGRLWFLIADVAGHGIAAAMVSMMLKGIFADLVPHTPEPGVLLERLNRKLSEILGQTSPYMMTAFAGCITCGMLCYANAGHPYPLIYHPATGESESLVQNGFVLGAFDGVEYETRVRPLRQGEWLLTYTDGVFGEKYGSRGTTLDSLMERLRGEIEDCGRQPDQLIARLLQQADGRCLDDVSIMIVRSARDGCEITPTDKK